MEIEKEARLAEVSRLKAERIKLELEAQEIERRLNTPWWQGPKLSQYLVAIIVTSALLFGWTRVYLEPILRQESQLTTLEEKRNTALNELLKAENKKLIEDRKVLQRDSVILTEERDQLKNERRELEKKRDKLTEERDQLKNEMGMLIKERDELTKEQNQLKNENEILKKDQKVSLLVVEGLNLAVDRAAERGGKFFSILNSDDPISKLESAYGWEMESDNYFGYQLGYYLVINHKNVMSNKKIFIGRTIEINELKRNEKTGWQKELKRVTDKAPILALDYSYFGLIVDSTAPVGGTIYKQNGETIKFYEPLEHWSERLGTIFQTN